MRDPLILLAGLFVTAVVSADACGFPTWCASKADPIGTSLPVNRAH